MLGKLMKYDFMKIRNGVILYGAIGLLLNIISMVYLLINPNERFEYLVPIGTFFLIMTVIYLVSIPIMILVMSVRLYTLELHNRCGYMTFSTPCHSAYIIASKLLVCICVNVGALILLIGFVMGDVALYSTLTTHKLFDIFAFSEIFEELLTFLSEHIAEAVLLCITAIFQWLGNVLVIYLAVTLGCLITNNVKLSRFLAVVLWIGMNVAITNVSSIGLMLFGANLTYGIGVDIIDADMSGTSIIAPLLFSLVVDMILAVGMYLLNTWLLEKKVSH